MSKQIKIIKNRSDIGAGTRGSDMGIDAIEIAAINAGNDFFNKHPYEDLETDNESVYNKVKHSFAKRIKYVSEQCSRVSKSVQESLENDLFPIVLSGDHSSALGTIGGIKAMFPYQHLGVIWIDAHADLHSPYTSPSGNVHGMPLAAALGFDNKESQINHVTEEVAGYWESLKLMSAGRKKIAPQNLIYFGVRDMEAAEIDLVNELGIRNYSVDEIRMKGAEVAIQEVTTQLSTCDHVYISFDVDSLDKDLVSAGTGTPVANGFYQEEVTALICGLVKALPVCCFEIAEVNPLLDQKGNKMGEVAFEILEAIVNEIRL